MEDIKKIIANKLLDNKKIEIELGPGNEKCNPNAIGIDLCKKDSVDHVADLDNGLRFLDNDSIDTIYAFHFLEHIKDLEFFMNEIYRVLKKEGQLIGAVPHFSNPYFYSDYTHKSFWGLYTFEYFSKKSYFKRGTPSYYNSVDFEIQIIKLHFSSPFKIRNKIKKVFEKAFNLNCYMQELYEENFIYLVPCYEISFELKK